jgi:hypothetical protein
MGLVGSSSFFMESTHNENNNKLKINLAHHCVLWVHINKTKKDDDKLQLVVIFFGCTKTKQKKTTTSIDSSLSSLGAQKQNKRRQQPALIHRRLLWVHKNKTKEDNNEC